MDVRAACQATPSARRSTDLDPRQAYGLIKVYLTTHQGDASQLSKT